MYFSASISVPGYASIIITLLFLGGFSFPPWASSAA
jgi:hypothetical protein